MSSSTYSYEMIVNHHLGGLIVIMRTGKEQLARVDGLRERRTHPILVKLSVSKAFRWHGMVKFRCQLSFK
jgi:hypothetical protein